jgi:teichoic acid transport system permease protein
MAKVDLVKTYRGAALGWLWAIINPVVTIFVYWFGFAIGLRVSKEISNYPFFLWLIAGVVPWFYMRDMISQGTDCMRKYSYLITKMKFPVSTIPTFVSLSKLIVNLILLSIVILIFWFMGYPPDIFYLQIPLYIVLSFLMFTMWGLFAAPIAAISKDFSNLIHSFVYALFWLSGILWDADKVKIVWLRKFLMLNPVTFLVNGFRNAFVKKIWFWQQPKRFGYFVFFLCVMFVLSIWRYKKLKKDIPDVL